MDRRAKLVAAGLLLSVFGAHAFVTPSPPPGFGGSPGSWTWTPPSAAQQVGQIMRGPGPMIPGGGASSAAYRLGPGAARALAGGIARGLIPGVGLALGVAWLASNCIGKEGGQWVRTCGPGLEQPISDGFEYQPADFYFVSPTADPWFSDPAAACQFFVGAINANYQQQTWSFKNVIPVQGPYKNLCNYGRVNKADGAQLEDFPVTQRSRTKADCPAGWYITPAGCMASPQPQTITPEEIEEEMAPKPLPNQLPPGFPYPLDPLAPSIFNPEPIAEPGADPKSRPWRVPQGNPVPVPNTNPQQYRQPVTRWTHSPTQSEPWRMDTRPEDIVGESPEGLQEPQSVTSGSPSGDKPEQFDLCKEHPDIIACQVFKPDDLQPLPVPNKEVPLALNAEGGFPTGGSCPQPKVVQLMGQTFSFSMQPLCDFATGIKPLLIGFAWLSAALVFLGVARREG